MNKYGLGELMDDYVYLEEMGRRVEGWGREIGRGGYAVNVGVSAGMGTRGGGRGRGFDGGGRGRGGRGRGGGGGGGGGTAQRTKRDILKMQLEARDVDVEMLPAGMERRSLNQSSWDFKCARFCVAFKLPRAHHSFIL